MVCGGRMKLRIWCVSSVRDSLEPLVYKWKLQRTPIRKDFDGCRVYSADTGNHFEYWIEINTLEELFALQKDLKELSIGTGWDNELVLSEWYVGKWKGEEYEKEDEGIGIKVYNEYME